MLVKEPIFNNISYEWEEEVYERYEIKPVPKPRMTRRDKWRKRPCVVRYHAFKDQVRVSGIKLPDGGAWILFKVPMPKSWSLKKKAEMLGTPCRSVPDVDNYLKALLDACYLDDSCVWDIRVTKQWATEGAIEIREIENVVF